MFCYLVDFTLCNIIMMVICRIVSCEFFCQNPVRQNFGKKIKCVHNFTLSTKCFAIWWILPCAILSWWSFAELSLVTFSVRIHSNKISLKYKDMCAQSYIICHIIHMLDIYHMQYYHDGHIQRPFVWVFLSEFIRRKHKWKTKIY